jgi:hypothetical protein
VSEGRPLRAEPSESVLRLYALAVEMADRVSARRATSNSFFLALQTGLATALGLFAVRANAAGNEVEPDRFVLVLAAVAGVILAAAWSLQLRAYRKLNQAKFEVINRIEETYFEVQPFLEEWALLKQEDPVKRRWQDRYTELGFVEQAVPVAFAIIYVVLAIYMATQ